MADPALAQALTSEREAFLTTYDADGKPGTVPVWFAASGGTVYITTWPNTRKVQKLRANPAARLALGARTGPAAAGRARFVTDPGVFQRAARLFMEKYTGSWPGPERLVSGWEREKAVLLEVTLEGV